MADSFKKNFSRTLITNIIIISVFYLAIFFIQRDINTRITAINSFKDLIHKDSSALKNLSELKLEDALAYGYGDFLSPFLSDKDGLLSFPKEIKKLAQDQKIDEGFSWTGEGQDQDFGFFNFDLSLKFPQLQQIISFISSAETSNRIVNFSRLDILRGASVYSTSVSGSVFYKK